MRIAVGLEYLGNAYAGWQRQEGLRTVQGEVENALSRVADHPVLTRCAGRTDEIPQFRHRTLQVVVDDHQISQFSAQFLLVLGFSEPLGNVMVRVPPALQTTLLLFPRRRHHEEEEKIGRAHV